MWLAKDQVLDTLARRAIALTLTELVNFTGNSHRTVQRAVATLVKEGRVSVSFSESREKLVSLASQSASPGTGRASSRGSSGAKRGKRTSRSGGDSGRSLKR